MYDIRFGIKVIEPSMIKCEQGEWLNLQCLEVIYVFSGKDVIEVWAMSKSQVRYLIKSGFKTKEEANKYISDLLDTLHNIK